MKTGRLFRVVDFARKLLWLQLVLLIVGNGCSLWKDNDEEELPDLRTSYNHSYPAWSPDGNLVAYDYGGNQYGTDTAGIFLFDLSDSTFRLLVAGRTHFPDFSPDGEWVVFDRYDQIYRIKTNADSLTQLTFTDRNYHPSWSPDGGKMTYDSDAESEGYGIWIMDSDGENQRRVDLGRGADWSPNGSRFVYNGLYAQIWVADTNGANRKQLTYFGVSSKNPAWSPDGSKIAFASCEDGEAAQIWVMDSEGENLEKLTTEGGDTPCWSPDGGKIAYTNTSYGDIWVMNTDGTGKQSLITEP